MKTWFSTVLVFFLVFIAITRCSTTTKQPEFSKTKVIERISSKNETPKWATGEKTMWVEGVDVLFAHSSQMDGDSRPEACMKASSLQAKTEMLRYISEAISISGQFSEVDLQSDPAYESLTAFLSQGKISGVEPRDRYWEKIEISNTSGERILKIHCAAIVAIKKTELNRQLKEATIEKPAGNPEIRKALLDTQKKFIENIE